MNKAPIEIEPLPTFLQLLLSLWTEGQTSLKDVRRWSNFSFVDSFPTREQNDLEHLHGITRLARILCRKIGNIPGFDSLLLLAAVTIHEDGEGLIREDTPFPRKSEAKDLEEYLAVSKSLEYFTPEIRKKELEAFLLQFAMKHYESFPAEAEAIMASLRQNHSQECYAFAALEYLDYLFYALEQKKLLDNDLIFIQVLRDQFYNLEAAAKHVPLIREILWTKEVRLWFLQVLKENQHRFPGRQGDPTEELASGIDHLN